MDRLLTIGSTGPDVSEVQAALNRRPPTQLPPLKVDRIFGAKTALRVKEFQRNNSLKPDGLVGPQTLASLREPQLIQRTIRFCDNPDPANAAASLAIRSGLVTSPQNSGQFQLASFSFPTLPIRPLSAAQTNVAIKIFGFSLDFARIFISNKKGAQGRPFTVAVPSPLNGTVQIMNCGTFTPEEVDLIHELAHVWQSQHHSNPTQFMTNAVSSQAAAVVANGLEAITNPTVRSNGLFPVQFPFSAYAFTPGKPFGECCAEQIATAVEKKDPIILSHVRSLGNNVVDQANVSSLATTRIGDTRTPGVLF